MADSEKRVAMLIKATKLFEVTRQNQVEVIRNRRKPWSDED